MLVAADHVIGVRGLGAFEDSIVVGVLFDHIELLGCPLWVTRH